MLEPAPRHDSTESSPRTAYPRTTLVATMTEPPSADGDELRGLDALGVGYLEVRADLVGDRLDPAWLRERFPGGLIYTLRSKAEGGRGTNDRKQRKQRLAAAVGVYDLIDLEADRDLEADLLVEVPPEKRLISWHGAATHLTGLKRRFDTISRTRARFYKMIPTATQSGDEIPCLALLHDLRRDDVICFAAGDIGSWTRVVAPRLGCPLIYGALTDIAGAPGQWTIRKLHEDFRLPELPPMAGLFGIVGKPVSGSLSPKLHNGAYARLGVDGVYVAFHVESFGDFWLEVVESGALEALGLPLRGLSVTSPHKEVALAVSGASSPRAQHIEAANTLVLQDRVWEAESTDPDGVVLALRHCGVELKGRRAAVVGCGGAGKAAAYGLQLAGAKVTLINRGADRVEKASRALGLHGVLLADFDPSIFDIVIQATALGRDPSDPFPFEPERLAEHAAVLDMVYGPRPTRLIERVRELGRIGV
ncbi:MAG: type I 3-dehydroquinate dehydratase, partial [Acidobacteriota bacterium]